MNILKTSVFLIFTLLLVPILSYFNGKSLGAEEWKLLVYLSYIVLFAIAYCFIVSELTKNNSQVDKLWSLLPILYVWIVAYASEFNIRLVVMAILVSIWGIRLSFNFALKGAYHWKFWAGEEDYRWKVLRQKPEFQAKWKWTLFNLFFISAYQNVLILLFTLPSIIAFQFRHVPWSVFDTLITCVMLFFIIYETIADIQQWNFQSKKWALLNAGELLPEDLKKGFLDRGLWAYSRHPNYFAEQAIWLSFYLFSVSVSGQWFNWSIVGALLLILLFQGSANFSEEISVGKYPEYKSYQSRVSKFIPFLK